MFFARGMTTIVKYQTLSTWQRKFYCFEETRVIVPGMGSVNKLGNYVNAYVEIGVIVALLVVILMFIMLRWTKMGRSFYAVGGNNQSADVRYQCEENQVHVPSALRTVGRYRRLCILPACRKRICFSCQAWR